MVEMNAILEESMRMPTQFEFGPVEFCEFDNMYEFRPLLRHGDDSD